MTLLDKEPIKRAEKSLKEFDQKQKIIVLENTARTALEAASSLGCEVGAIVKSLLFRTENTFTLFLIAGDKRASLNKIKKTQPMTVYRALNNLIEKGLIHKSNFKKTYMLCNHSHEKITTLFLQFARNVEYQRNFLQSYTLRKLKRKN